MTIDGKISALRVPPSDCQAFDATQATIFVTRNIDLDATGLDGARFHWAAAPALRVVQADLVFADPVTSVVVCGDPHASLSALTLLEEATGLGMRSVAVCGTLMAGLSSLDTYVNCAVVRSDGFGPERLRRASLDLACGLEGSDRPNDLERAAALTSAERAVLHLLASGCKHKAIAQILHIAPDTVDFRVRSAKRKLGSSTLSQLVVDALRKGWICVDGLEPA